jgi:DNA-binding CsgD family transcriptional regulator
MTNPQIAERLIMSRATVKTHVAHALSKTGSKNRSELASVFTRRSG